MMFDENLAPALARSLSALFAGEHEIISLRDRYPAGTPDLSWIDDLSSEGGWVVLSGDRRITKNKLEYIAFRHSGIVGFFLARSVYRKAVRFQMIRILQVWSELETQTRLVSPGAMFEIPERSSRFRQL